MHERLAGLLVQFRRLCRMTTAQRKQFVKHCDKEFITSLSECIKNIVNGNVKLNHRQLQSLRRHKQSLRKLSLKKTSTKVRRKILQKGGFLSYLIAPIVAGIGQFLANASEARHGTR